ncbi:hypothetical protein SAMN05421823_11953 [Catalinimonas alkaloidigena]|uniref:Uncharacterized protein n=1 Tax=Catalinimonas alkaloidigena TaxID=1075417 RepID=A0A1G9V8N2_9BACT|nr:hypothetical protein SAMN05421823_11953 [Catalinimonas alkaloidigena]
MNEKVKSALIMAAVVLVVLAIYDVFVKEHLAKKISA